MGGGDRFKPNMVDQFNDRPKTSLPMTKLPKQKFAWNQNITEDNLKILEELDRNDRNSESKSLFKDADWPIYKYKLGSKRTGLIMKKIGVEALWLKDGTKQIWNVFNPCQKIARFTSAAKQFDSNLRNVTAYRHEHNGKEACVIVGTGLGNPYLKNENYLDYCLDAGVSPKAKLARFPITENARIEPGRQLHLQHFHVGQKVDIVQRSVDYGFQDVVTRFHKKEVRRPPSHGRMWKIRGRHVGSVAGRGNTRQNSPNWFNDLSGRPLKGRRMPGQLGGCDTPAWSRKVLRMNTKLQIMWIKGRTPGHIGDYARVYDTRTSANMIGFAKEAPMFPTYMPEYHGTEWTDEIFDVSVHPFDEPSNKCMEGVGLVSIEGHPLLVRTLSGEFPTTYLLTLFSSEKFAKEQSDCTIILSESDTKKIGWRKKFDFILIGWFCKETNDDLVCRLLSYAEDVLMMFMGQEDLESLDQASKRDLRLCYPILDSLLTSVDDIPPFIVVEYPIKPINSISNLDVQLNQWAEEIETPYAAIVDGNVLVQATPDFEESLAHEEINLIIQIVKLSSSAAVLEIPVYMPRSFPNAAHRLIIARLFDEVTAIGLCGVNPPLSKVFLNPPFVAFNDQLRSRRTTPRELLHSSLLGFIVQDIPAKKSAFYIHPRKMSVMEDEMNKVEISQSLLNIYQKSKLAAYSPHSEYYAVRKEFKAYVLKEDGRHMVFLFAPEVPIFALKEIAQQSANQLVNIRL